MMIDLEHTERGEQVTAEIRRAALERGLARRSSPGTAATLRGTLATAEPHPAAYSALEWLASVPLTERMMWMESFSSAAIEGNRLAEICAETLRRTMEGEAVSDRYLLGLVWTMQSVERDERS